MDYTVHGNLQARILEWVAIPFSMGSSQPRDRTQVSCIAAIHICRYLSMAMFQNRIYEHWDLSFIYILTVIKIFQLLKIN